MKKPLLLSILLLTITLNVGAQLANWSVGSNPDYTDFPTNLSGQINGTGRYTTLKFHPTDPNKMYTVSAEGGFFVTTDAGTTWTVKSGTENLVSKCATLCIDRTNDQVIYLGTGDPNYYTNGQGLFKSVDGGNTFAPTTLTNCLVVEVLQSPTVAGTFIAITNKGAYKSTDNAATWTATTATNIEFCDLKQNTALNSQTLYACTKEDATKFYRSTDFGGTWTQITSGIITSTSHIQAGARIGVTPANPLVVYLEAIGGGGIIHKSTDGGLTFTVTKGQSTGTAANPFLTYYTFDNSFIGGQGNYNNCFTVDRNDPAKIWLQSHNTWYSADSGVTWTMLTFWSTKVHTDMHHIEQSPHNANNLYSCNDGGVFLSTDGGNNWTPKSDGLYTLEVYNNCGAASNTDKNVIVVGTQDNGRNIRTATSWNNIGGGDDGRQKHFDYLPNGGYYYEYGEGNRGAGNNGPGTPTGFTTPGDHWKKLAFNRTNVELGFMWFTDNNLYRTTNLSANTPSWPVVASFTEPVSDMHSAIADPNRLYVLTSDGYLHVSSNALSATPTFTVQNIPVVGVIFQGSVTAIANNANTVYLHIDNQIFVSIDAGANWTDITYNLPNVNHRRIISEKFGGTEELVFVATNNAVYYKKAGQVTWTNYSTNLPGRQSPTNFDMYDDGTNQARIRYYSYGRGVWESPFDNLRTLNAEININGATDLTCSNPTIQFEDGSVGTNNTPITYAWSFPGGTPATSSSQNQAVSYPSTGTYSITLTITDALSNTSTKTITRDIQVITCATDTIPGSAIQINGGSNYASLPSVALGNTNTVTLSTWMKIDAAQPSFAGILAVGGGSGTSLNFMNGNQIGYTWNDSPSTYNYTGAPVIASGVWTHVALVVTPTNATIYVNGVGYTNNVANAAHDFSTTFNLGNDRNNTTRTMTGALDEVCIYNRALSQDEIRELMHLTRNQPVVDATLLHYYQFNEVGTTIYDRAGAVNATLNGTSTHLTSTAPVGGGTSSRQTITASGTNNFVNEGLSLTFGAGTIPDGEICVSRLNVKPDAAPTGTTLANAGEKYWIVNNYGVNSTFTTSVNSSATGFGAITAPEATTPNAFKLYSRNTGDFASGTWALIDSASSATAGANGVLGFTGALNTTFNKQFTVTKSVTGPFDITASTGANGTVTPAGVTSVTSGANQVYTITPSACYQIADVLVDGVSQGAIATYTFTNVTATHTISATFSALPANAITATAGTNGTITPNGATNVACGASQTYTIAAAACYQIADVLVDGVSQGAIATYTFTNVTAAHTISATFSALPANAITASAGANGTITPSGATNVNCGADQVYTITADACYQIADVLVDGVSQGAIATYTFTNVTATHTISATFTAAPTNAITATAGTNGTITPSGATNVNCGADQVYTITADACYQIADVLVDGVSQGAIATYTFTNVTAAHTISATFTALPANAITASAGANGTITPSGATNVACGASQTYTIAAAACYQIADVLVDGVSQGAIATYTFTNVTAAHTISATFSALPTNAITATAGTNGTITPSGATNVNCGADQVYTITADACYQIADVLVDGVSQGAIATYTFTNVTATHTISATFTAAPTNAITATAGTNGTITPSGATNVNCGADQVYTITADACYQIADVLVDGVSQGAIATYTFTNVTAAHTISATFTALPANAITASAGANGTITPSGATNVACGASQTYTIAAAACYQIADVLVDGVSQGAIATYTFTNVTAAHTISATFSALPANAITASAGANGTITPSGATNVNCGADQVYTITADACYQIADVLVDGVSQGAIATYTFTNVTADHTISATFSALPANAITATAGANGTITPSGATNVNCGADQVYTIIADACYQIADVLVDGISQGAIATYTFTNVTAAHTISATFTALPANAITASAGANGTITPSGATNVACGASQTYTIAAAACYQIADVLVDGVSQGAISTYTFTNVTAAHTISATFTALPTNAITASAGANGTITPSGATNVNCGADQVYTITADACYQIADVLVDGVSQGAIPTYTFTNVTADHTISATFSALPANAITATAGANGTITPSGATNVNCGADQVYTIIADACYQIADVLVDGISQGAIATYTFTNVTADHTISATFTILPSSAITATAGADGTITPSGVTDVNCGDDLTYTITPDSCYQVYDVWVDGVSQGAITTYTFTNVTADHTIEADFYPVVPTPTIVLTNGVDLTSDAATGNQWYNQNGEIVGAIDQDHTATENGTYYVIVTVGGCSSDPSNDILIDEVDLYELDNGMIVNIYPNPVYDELIIEMKGNTEDIGLEILDAQGKIVYVGSVKDKLIIPTTDFPNGVYIVRLENDKSFEFKKIVKQ